MVVLRGDVRLEVPNQLGDISGWGRRQAIVEARQRHKYGRHL